MKATSSVNFNSRWDQAIKSPAIITADVTPVTVNLSMETIMDRYLKSVEAEVAEHKISQTLCNQLAGQFTQAKSILSTIENARQSVTTSHNGKNC